MSKHNKNVHTSCEPEYLQSHELSYFFDFFSIFQIYCSHAYKIYDFLCHELSGCPNGTQICTRLADMTIFDPTKFHIFLIFLLFFSGWSKYFDRTVTEQKGISISDTNGRGAKLSIPEN